VIEGIVGTKLADRFLVERWLGEGGMGVVFEALDEARGERAAEKESSRIIHFSEGLFCLVKRQPYGASDQARNRARNRAR